MAAIICLVCPAVGENNRYEAGGVRTTPGEDAGAEARPQSSGCAAMPKLPARDQRLRRAHYQARRGLRGSHIAALQARVAELEAQSWSQRALQAAAPTERLNTLLAVSAALLVTHDIEAIMSL